MKSGESVVNETDNDSNVAAERPQSFFRRYGVIILVVLGFAALVLGILHHHKVQQEQQAALGSGPGRGGGGPPGMGASGGGRSGSGGRGGAGGGPNSAVAVTVAPVTSGDIEVRIPALGTVTPLATVTVRTQISGILTKIAFQEGQLVKAGALLAQIDPRPYEAALGSAQGNLARDQALLADSKLDLARYQDLIKEDSVSQQQLDTQRALVDQYVGTVEADKAAVRTAQINLEF